MKNQLADLAEVKDLFPDPVPVVKGLALDFIYDNLPEFFESIEAAETFASKLRFEIDDIHGQLHQEKIRRSLDIEADMDWLKSAFGAARVKKNQCKIVEESIRHYKMVRTDILSGGVNRQVKHLLEKEKTLRAEVGELKVQVHNLKQRDHDWIRQRLDAEKEKRVQDHDRNDRYFQFFMRSLYAIVMFLISKNKKVPAEIEAIAQELQFIPEVMSKRPGWGRDRLS